MMTQTTLRRKLGLACVGMALVLGTIETRAAGASANGGLPNPFFAMDTSVRDRNHLEPQSQMKMLKELGFDGFGASAGALDEVLVAVDQYGLKLHTFYAGVFLGNKQSKYYAALPEAIKTLKGRDTIIWLYITSKTLPDSAEAGDEEAVAIIRDLADQAKASGLRIALYPHTDFWLERTQDAVRVAKKVDRPNVGVTFNLCHALKQGEGDKIMDTLKEAMPHLFAVTINGADPRGTNWATLIQTLDRGTFDLAPVLQTLKDLGYKGPIGLQHYGIRGDAHENLRRSMDGWRKYNARLAAGK
jgi:sugar phosphate isomerase/epimerase